MRSISEENHPSSLEVVKDLVEEGIDSFMDNSWDAELLLQSLAEGWNIGIGQELSSTLK